MNDTALLRVREVSRHFGGVRALDGVSLEVTRMLTALIGPNGAGKTTLFNVICGVLAPTSGSVVFRGAEIAGRRMDQVVRLGVSRTFQQLGVFPDLTVEENVTLGLFARERASYLRLALERRHPHREVDEVLDLLDLERVRAERVGALSFGTQRLVDLARAAVSRPAMLLLDEPASGLVAAEKKAFSTVIRRLVQERGIAVVIVEHDMGVVMSLAEEIFVLDRGRLIASGTPREILTNPVVHEAYLGRMGGGDARR